MRRPNFCLSVYAGLLAATLAPSISSAMNLADTPLFLAGSVTPLVMLNLSKDHQLSYKAYNDYSDLNGDGQPETTYNDSVDYYGYFDSRKCYTYNEGAGYFEPIAGATGPNHHYCSGHWSGNFLNWATMTRMDVVRKLLYGGHRVVDTATLTVLERHYLPTDAHAFAKYYNGSDIASLTPFSGIANLPPSASSSTSVSIPTSGSHTLTFNTSLPASVGDQIKVFRTGHENTHWMIGGVTGVSGTRITIQIPAGSYAGSGRYNNWTLQNLSRTGITLCNLTLGSTSGNNRFSHSNTNPPFIRVARGNFALWSASERWQCYWSEEKNNLQGGFWGGFRSNGNRAHHSGLNASAENPSRQTHGLGNIDFIARVKVCDPTRIGHERCRLYGSTYKPIGLLHIYSDRMHFGLMTGSYAKNISGGVLRKNITSFADEVNTDGTFNTSVRGIVHNLNKLRLYGYDYTDGSYIQADACTYQQTGLVLSGGQMELGQPANQGNCSSWGNPMSEVYLESLRYLAGRNPTSDFIYPADSKDATLGLTLVSWISPLNQQNFCAPLNVLNFNASVASYDNDQMGGVADLGASGAVQLTNAVGQHENIGRSSWFVGNNGQVNNNLCTAKAGSVGLGQFTGICPEAPTQKGTYLMAGVAHHARTNRIRTDLSVPAGAQFANALKVNTYGIALATNVPRIEVSVNDRKVTILPAYRLDVQGRYGGGTLVDFKIVTQTPTYGKFYLNWEDSEMGGDYDQDMWGTIEYRVNNNNTITITTDAISASTANPQGFGYIISGTDRDGAHFHSGIYGFNFTDPTGVTGCSNCILENPPTSWTYNVTGGSGDQLRDPLWYVAKYGGFNDNNGNRWPDPGEFDVLNNTTGLPGGDGVPDNFFYVTNPLGLERSLNAAFLKILQDASAGGVAVSSSMLKTGNRIYQGRFNNSTWSGQLLSYRLSAGGSIESATTPPPGWDPADRPYPEWDAGQKIKEQVNVNSDSRLILTRGQGGGREFVYTNLTPDQKAALNRNVQGVIDGCGPERVQYLRGRSMHEGVGTFTCASGSTTLRFRPRPISILGDIVHSSPVYVGPPSAGYSDVDHPGYEAFSDRFKNRTPVVYVGANDGMLHGFDASVNPAANTPTSDAGKEVIAYVPTPVYQHLSRLTDFNYNAQHKYFVDSTPMVADACVSTSASCTSDWRTVLIGGLGAGGRGYYALNITNPKDVNLNSSATPVFNAANAANILLWEFTHHDNPDLGFTFNYAPTNLYTGQSRQIVKFENGRWGVVVGNGYGGSGGRAVLFILFLSGPGNTWVAGNHYIRIIAHNGPNNGLSTPITFDADGDGLVDTVYAGDLQGHLWKFDLSSSDPAQWRVAFNGSALFRAMHNGVPQPITAPPEVTIHPHGGRMVLFGTGKYLETADNTNTARQTFYGIHDNNAPVSHTELMPVIISTTNIGGTTFRTTSHGCGVGSLPACPNPPKGWYADLPATGERHTGIPKLIGGTIYFNTFIPSTAPCEFGGTGWLMVLNYTSGLMLTYAPFDTNRDATVDAYDTTVAGIQIGASLGGTTMVRPVATGNFGVGITALTTGATATTPIRFPPGYRGRISWREIFQ